MGCCCKTQAYHHHGRRWGTLAGVLCLDSGLGRRLESGFMDARRRAGSFLEICKQWLACVARRDRILTPAGCDARPQGSTSTHTGSCPAYKDQSSHARPLRCNLFLDPDPKYPLSTIYLHTLQCCDPHLGLYCTGSAV